MKYITKFWLGAMPIFLLVQFFPAPALAITDHLVISQVQITAGSGKTTHDFIEIHNPTNQSVDLQGYRLVKRTKEGDTDTLIKSFTESFIIPSMGYFLWANSDYTEIAVSPDIATSATIAADNAVALRNGPNDTGLIMDSVGWGGAINSLVEATAFPESPGAGQALRRKNNFTDTNNNSADFELGAPSPRNLESSQGEVPNSTAEIPQEQAKETNNQADDATSSQPASTPASTPPAPSVNYDNFAKAIIINEIVPNPEGADQGNEWVEFYNSGPSQIDLSDWHIDDSGETLAGSAHKIEAGTKLTSGGYLTIVLPKGSPALNNSGGDCAQLYSPDKVLRHKICYTESLSEGESYARKSDNSYEVTSVVTKSAENSFPEPIEESKVAAVTSNIAINELYPNPEGEQDEEFIELINLGQDEVDLAGWEIADRSRTYKIKRDDFTETEIGPSELFVLPRTITRIALNNSGGEQVILFNPQGDKHATVEYAELAPKGESFIRTDEGDYAWSTVVTSGRQNILEGSEVLELLEENFDDQESFEEGEEVVTASLADLRELPIDSKVWVSGKVSVVPGMFGAQVMYLAGSGIRVWFSSSVGIPQLTLGDLVLLTARLSTSRNELQLVVGASDTIKVEDAGDVPIPYGINTGQVGEETEGQLVKISGTVTRSSGDTFYMDDGSGEARILVMDSTDINKPETRKGDTAVVTGIVTQFGNIYRVLPRMQSDIEVGGILGGGLPRTGLRISEFVLLAILLLILAARTLKLEQFNKYLR